MIKVDFNKPYSLGNISQECSSCDWSGTRSKVEVRVCPKCGSEIDKATLHFGGISVHKLGFNRFEFIDTSGQKAYLDEADVPDTIMFLLKHNKFWYK